MENISAVLHGKNDLRLENRPIPQPGLNEVQIEMRKVGLCGSDLHLVKDAEIIGVPLVEPLVVGHESSGVVTKVGDGVKHLKIGDRVAIEPATSCRFCIMCKSGKYNQCPDVKGLALPPVHGSLCRYFVHAADFCHRSGDRVAIEPVTPCRFCLMCKNGNYNQCPDIKGFIVPPTHGSLCRYLVHAADFCHRIPDSLSFEDGAFAEPLSVGVHACKRAGVALGDKVLITGAGPIGLICMMVAKAMGGCEVFMTDIDQKRLDFAKKTGSVDYTLMVHGRDIEEIVENVIESFGCKADITIECSGADSGRRLGVYATRSSGVVQLVGMGTMDMVFPIGDALVREIDIRGSFRYVNCYPVALKMMASGVINPRSLITHRFTLEEIVEAFQTFNNRDSGAIKVMVDCFKQ